jgi:hypothetical protein
MRKAKYLVALALTGGVGFGSFSEAATIGVNLIGRNDAANPLTPTQTAGQIPQQNWNTGVGSGSAQGTETYSNLVNSAGTASAITLSATYSDSWSSGSGHTTPDNTLLNGIIKISPNGGGNNTGTLTWNNVPAGTYNVVLELAENGAGAVGAITVGGNTQTVTEVDGGSQTATVTYTNNAAGANYVSFANVSPVAGAITIGIVHTTGSDGFGIGGAQLQSTVPEPASVGLLGLGGIGLLVRRRRATKA